MAGYPRILRLKAMLISRGPCFNNAITSILRYAVFSKSVVLLYAGSLFFTPTLRAEYVPEAGSILRNQQSFRLFPQQFPVFEKEEPRSASDDTDVRITVRSFVFTGHMGLATEGELQAVVAGSVGKSMSYNELQALAETLTEFLKQKGWFLARAYLPKQDVTAGTVEIAVIPGKSDGSILLDADKSVRIDQNILRSMGGRVVRSGEPINSGSFERAMLLMNDLPGIRARSSIGPGSEPGSSSVGVSVSEGPLFTGAIWGDNYGNRYTGSWRGNAMLWVNDPFRRGDQISLMVSGAEGLIQGSIGYGFPLTYDGMRGSISYTGMAYRLIGELESLGNTGYSNGIDIGLSYDLRRSRTSNIKAEVLYGYHALTDRQSTTDIRSRKISSVTLSLTGDSHDSILGGGYTRWNVGCTTGNFQESVADISYTKTEGHFTRFNLGVTRLQRLAERVTLTFSWNAQKALGNLDSSEKFYLGGPNGVRAYPVGEGAGDQGHLINTDIRYTIPGSFAGGSLQLCGFYDAGYINLNKEPVIPLGTATNRNSYWLQDAGFGLKYTVQDKFVFRGCWAHAIGDNPGRSVTGKNSDGKSDTYRFWLQSLVYF